MKRLLVTAALPYSNGKPHVGHIAGCYLSADTYVRYQRLLGKEVRFVCGSDDHGVAIVLSAEKEGKTPREVAEYYGAIQRQDFASLGIHFDVYGSTSRNPFHAQTSQALFLTLFEKGYLKKREADQFYDPKREAFLPDRFVTGMCGYCSTPEQNGDQCENCGKVLDTTTLLNAHSVLSGEPAIVKKTVHWFLDLSQFSEEVSQWIDSAVIRDHTRNYVRGLLSTGLVQRSMTRDLDWGIPVPLEDPEAKGKVLYVWFDAPIGYISNTMQLCEEVDGDASRFSDWWKSEDCEIFHFIGEDNTIFHCVIWIAMLSAEGSYRLPKGVIVNQFLNIQFPDKNEAEKISKSRGTAIWVQDYIRQGGNPDSLRYYLTAIAPERSRSVYKPEDLVQRNNSDLANTIGNFVNRIVSFTRKYCGESLPACGEALVNDIDREYIKHREETFRRVSEQLDSFQFKPALESVMEFARASNRYVDEQAPWKTRATDMPRTETTLKIALDSIYCLGVLLSPFLPFSSEKIVGLFGNSGADIQWQMALEAPAAGSPLGEPVILFQKMEPEEWVPQAQS